MSFALNDASMQPVSDRALGRFRERCSAYEKETGTDLLHDTIVSLSGEMAEMMRPDLSLRRMDSLMVASNIKKMGRLELLYTCVADLAKEAAAEKNVRLVAANLTGREAEDIAADFGFNEEGTKVERCAGGFEPRSCSHNPRTGQCTASFCRSQCEQCPHRGQCRPKFFKRTCRKTISANTKRRAEQQRYRGTEAFRKLSHFRNGVETIPSILRRKYGVDHMPVRGLIRSRLFFGCKIGALNFGKFCRYMQGCDKYT